MTMKSLNNMIALLFISIHVSSRVVSCLECPSDNDYDADVLIFGAGITGITVARHLNDNGITDIKVLEARSEIGGRIRDVEFAGARVEIGANWIQEVPESDRNVHPIWQLAKDSSRCTNLVGHFTETGEFWNLNEDDEYVELGDNGVGQLQEDYEGAFERSRVLTENLRSDGEDDITVREAFNRVDWRPSTPSQVLTEWLNFDFGVAAAPNETSSFGTFPDFDNGLGDGDYFISDQRGFASFLDCITDGIESKIQLGAMVNNISWSNDCVCASVSINGSTDQTMCGRYGVVTFSNGVLQDWIRLDQPRFYPQLSTRKQSAINALGMGYYLKIFVHFETTFWNSEVDNIFRADTYRGYFPVVSPLGQLLPGSPGVIIMTVVGSEALRITNQDLNTTKEEIMTVLRGLYGNNIPNISDILVPTWINDPLYRGMYSYTRFGSTQEDLAVLKQPEGNRLYFSGEGLSAAYPGYVHGGYCEGLTTGDSILEAEGRTDSTSSLPSCPSGSLPVVQATVSVVIITAMVIMLIIY